MFRKQLGADELNVVRDYKKKHAAEEFSGLTGLVKLMEMAMGRHEREESSAQKKIAVIYAVGVIVSGKEGIGPDQTAYRFRKEIERQLDILGLSHFKFFQVGWFSWACSWASA